MNLDIATFGDLRPCQLLRSQVGFLVDCFDLYRRPSWRELAAVMAMAVLKLSVLDKEQQRWSDVSMISRETRLDPRIVHKEQSSEVAVCQSKRVP